MQSKADNLASSTKKLTNKGPKQSSHNMSDMPKPEAKRLVLEFMHEYDVPMPPKVLHRSLRLKSNFTYSDETLLNYLGELVESGAVSRVDPQALEQRELVPTDDSDLRAYYVITDAGRERIGKIG